MSNLMSICERLNPFLAGNLTEQECTFFEKYLQSPDAILHAIEVQEESLVPKGTLPLLFPMLKGAVFETIANSYLLSEIKKNQRFFPSGEMKTLYKSLFPKKEVLITHPLTEGVKGITIPNGMLMEKKRKFWQVKAVYEMQSGNGAQQDENQALFYENAARALTTDFKLDRPDGKEKFAGLLNRLWPDFDILPVELDPKNFNVIEVIPEYSFSESPYEKIPVPLTRINFETFINSMIIRCSEESTLLPGRKLTTDDLVKLAETVRRLTPPIMEEIYRSSAL